VAKPDAARVVRNFMKFDGGVPTYSFSAAAPMRAYPIHIHATKLHQRHVTSVGLTPSYRRFSCTMQRFGPKTRLSARIRAAVEQFSKDREAAVQNFAAKSKPVDLSEALRRALGSDSETLKRTLAEHPILLQPVRGDFAIRLQDGFAESVVTAALSGTTGENNSMGRFIAQGLRDGELSDYLLAQRVEELLAATLLPDLAIAAERTIEIASFVVEHQPSPPVSRYLERLSRCYLAGFDSECVILCRAVLESAIRERFASEFPAVSGTMREKLALATSRGWLSESTATDAFTVWVRGNKAVHEDPELVRDVFGTVRMVLGVLDELLSYEPLS
jgi:hypothetical protein